MANLVRPRRIGLALFAVIFAVTHLYRLVTGAGEYNDKYIYWSPDSSLQLADFKKMPHLFDTPIAMISLNIQWGGEIGGYLHAVPVVNRYDSYFRESEFSKSAMRHEEYHANVAAFVVRELNDSLGKITFDSREEVSDFVNIYRRKIKTINAEYDKYVHQYGHESAYQDYWEYKIDSMYYCDADLDIKDQYSGMTAFFPVQPEIIIERDSFSLSRAFLLTKYNMTVRFTSSYDSHADTTKMRKYITDYLRNTGCVNIKAKDSRGEHRYILDVVSEDTSRNERRYDRIIYDFPYEYQIAVFHPIDSMDSSPYVRMKNNFLNSITLTPNDEYWIEMSEIRELQELEMSGVHEPNLKGDFNIICTYRYTDYSIFYHEPIFHEDYVLIPFKPVDHTQNEIEEIFVKVNDKYILSQPPDSMFQLVKLIPHEVGIEEDINRLQFGYILKADSADKCHIFHGTLWEASQQES